MPDSEQPLIRTVLGPDWDRLPALVQAHFNVATGPGARSSVTVTGTMDEVSHYGLGRLLFPLLGLFRVLVPHQGRDVPFSVVYTVDEDYLYWHREFRFADKQPYVFDSRMCCAGAGFGIEYVRFGIGIRMHIYVANHALVFEGVSFVWKLGRWRLPLPVGWLIGRAVVTEWAQDDALRMSMTLEHPWFGTMFVYRGTFNIA